MPRAAPLPTVSAALETLDYPISKRDAIARVGRVEILAAPDVRVELGDLLRGVPGDVLRDRRTTAAAVDTRWHGVVRNLAAVERAERAAVRH